jgi:MerR family mercuric resistance operon transcriptional regulator
MDAGPVYSRGMSIGEVTRRTGFSADTIRYYERLGLLSGVDRTQGGHRQYDRAHLRRLSFIRRGRRLGLSLEELRLLAVEETSSCETVKGMLRRRSAEVRRQLSELRAIERELSELLAICGDGQLPDCRVAESMQDGEQGTAPSPSCCG